MPVYNLADGTSRSAYTGTSTVQAVLSGHSTQAFAWFVKALVLIRTERR